MASRVPIVVPLPPSATACPPAPVPLPRPLQTSTKLSPLPRPSRSGARPLPRSSSSTTMTMPLHRRSGGPSRRAPSCARLPNRLPLARWATAPEPPLARRMILILILILILLSRGRSASTTMLPLRGSPYRLPGARSTPTLLLLRRRASPPRALLGLPAPRASLLLAARRMICLELLVQYLWTVMMSWMTLGTNGLPRRKRTHPARMRKNRKQKCKKKLININEQSRRSWPKKKKTGSGKDALRSIVAEIDPTVLEIGSIGGSLLTRFAEKNLTFQVKPNPMRGSILWKMVPQNDQHPVSEVSYILFVLQAQESCDLIRNGAFFNHVLEVRARYPTFTICYVINKLVKCIKQVSNISIRIHPVLIAGNVHQWKRYAFNCIWIPLNLFLQYATDLYF
ncbi:uncharacterized protein LOC100834452 isoform X1 [Brachypodium distachyon]|uniref:uncharacterized protein LOC100834452 isoform X1 n=1 Tax=Brachypodium distachyon TaxID=15368 RepID=UPI000D0CBEFF|nr:uncharacterized protein LOC100834452 isoform X1 [Brachypodium distachyon]|eukprot:XP_024311271.1 uncharacterized protein LOC100834452 isoform X1 [Brachypodium distachyon]